MTPIGSSSLLSQKGSRGRGIVMTSVDCGRGPQPRAQECGLSPSLRLPRISRRERRSTASDGLRFSPDRRASSMTFCKAVSVLLVLCAIHRCIVAFIRSVSGPQAPVPTTVFVPLCSLVLRRLQTPAALSKKPCVPGCDVG